MNDYNFFEPYLHSVKNKNKGKTLVITLSILVVAAVGTLYVFNMQGISALEDERDEIVASVKELESYGYVEKMNELKAEETALEEKLGMIVTFEVKNNMTYIITDELIEQITSLVPRDMYFESMDISGNSISISGFAFDRSIIAEYEYALRQFGIFDGMHVDVISESTDNNQEIYTFSINFSVLEVE